MAHVGTFDQTTGPAFNWALQDKTQSGLFPAT